MMKNRRPSEVWQLAGEVRATPLPGNVIICYLPQQRTRGCTKLLFLVTATKQICQHCFLLSVFSQSYPDQTPGKELLSLDGA